MEQQEQRPAFGRPTDWDKMTDEQKKQWALEMLRAATDDGDQADDESDGENS